MNENFSNKGYYIVRNALRPRLLLEIQKNTLSYIKKKLMKKIITLVFPKQLII